MRVTKDDVGVPKRLPREHDFGQTQEQWETAVFENASYFRTALWVGPGRYESKLFKDLPDAIQDATHRLGSHGRRPILSAVTATKRFIILDKADWPLWLARWKRKHQ